MGVIGEITASPLEVAIACGIPVFGILIAVQASLTHWRRVALTGISFVGIAMIMVGLALSSSPLLLSAAGLLGTTALSTWVALAAEGPITPEAILARLPEALRGRRSGPAYALGLILLVVAGVATGLLLGGSSSKGDSTSVVLPGRYRVSGTCANGSCTVNECEHRAPCGLNNEGRLHEGERVDIVCQAKGKEAEAPNGRDSDIWDRLPNGWYISDLFVSGTKTDKFTKSLKRCASA